MFSTLQKLIKAIVIQLYLVNFEDHARHDFNIMINFWTSIIDSIILSPYVGDNTLILINPTLSSASESNFRSRSGLDAPNLPRSEIDCRKLEKRHQTCFQSLLNSPEALLRFPSLATDRLLALLGVGEGGLKKKVDK